MYTIYLQNLQELSQLHCLNGAVPTYRHDIGLVVCACSVDRSECWDPLVGLVEALMFSLSEQVDDMTQQLHALQMSATRSELSQPVATGSL